MIRIFLFLFISLVPLTGEVLFDPPSLTLPEGIREGEPFEGTFLMENRSGRILDVEFISSGEGWSAEPRRIVLEGNAAAEISIAGTVGDPDKGAAFLLMSDRDDLPYLYSVLPYAEETVQDTAGSAGHQDSLVFYFSPGCAVCERFYDEIPRLEREYGKNFRVEKKNIYNPGNMEELEDLADVSGRKIREFPVLAAEGQLFQGEEELFSGFPRYLETGTAPGQEETGGLAELRWFPVFLAGLLDGINPCAFTSLIFLISYLRLLGRKGKDILVIGGSFTAAVFITYFLAGLGAFQFIRMSASFPLISSLLKYVLAAALVILGVLSFVDYIYYRKGRAGDSILQLSKKRKRQIHGVLRRSSRSPLLLLSSFGAGALISLYELSCTGQIYLPMLVYMFKQGSRNAIGPLLLYNAAFILPLALVFFLFYKGSDSEAIATVFQRHLGRIKVATALLFWGMAAFLLLF